MNNSFIHGLWGIYSNKSHWWSRLSKCDQDIKLYKLNPYSPKTVVYIFGEDNFKRMTDLGFDCRLIDKKPYVWDMETEQYRHKMEIWKHGLLEFDSVSFLDWDTIACKPIPKTYWDEMNSGEPIRSSIYVYHKKRVNRLPNDCRKVSSASFVYIRGLEHINKMIKLWEDMGRPWKEEYALSLYIDNLNSGWKGISDYKKYDVPYYQIHYLKELTKKDLTFVHCNKNVVSRLIGSGQNVKDRIDSIASAIQIKK